MRRLAVGAVVGVVALGSVLMVPASVAATVPVWSVVSRPNKVAYLFGVSCVSSSSCKAVGASGNNTATQKTFVESWNGSAWSVTSSPAPQGSTLFGVSCVSAVWCQAVGSSLDGVNALTERWNGHAWSTTSNPASGTVLAQLNGVSCVSRTSCMAVGFDIYPNASSDQTLIESWDGHAWSIVPSPSPGDFFDSLLGVSCSSRRSCIAVGLYENRLSDNSILDSTLIESWNGKVWSFVASTDKPTDGAVYLRGVSCVSTTACVAVGDTGTGSLIESWNGHVWSVVSGPSRGKGDQLNGVSCVSAVACQAVGFDYNAIQGQTLIEAWNGRVWSIASSPNVGTGPTYLFGVSCARATSCQAVGDGQLIEMYG